VKCPRAVESLLCRASVWIQWNHHVGLVEGYHARSLVCPYLFDEELVVDEELGEAGSQHVKELMVNVIEPISELGIVPEPVHCLLLYILEVLAVHESVIAYCCHTHIYLRSLSI